MKQDRELISIIVPVYNVEDYLGQCVNSLINQTYTNLEIILVDDGATDKSGVLCDILAEKDTRIKVIHKKNGGLSDARNAGIDVATGTYIGFVDSDDWIDEDMFSKLINSSKKFDADISFCAVTVVYDRQFVNRSLNIDNYCMEKDQAVEMLLHDDKCKSFAWNKLYKRELFKEIRFPVGKYFEDVFIMHEIFENANRVAYVDDGLYFYRQREGSIMHMKAVTAWMDYLEAVEKRINYYKNENDYIKILSSVMFNAIKSTKTCLYTLNMSKGKRKEYNKL